MVVKKGKEKNCMLKNENLVHVIHEFSDLSLKKAD